MLLCSMELSIVNDFPTLKLCLLEKLKQCEMILVQFLCFYQAAQFDKSFDMDNFYFL